jgi:hypothetical protein
MVVLLPRYRLIKSQTDTQISIPAMLGLPILRNELLHCARTSHLELITAKPKPDHVNKVYR